MRVLAPPAEKKIKKHIQNALLSLPMQKSFAFSILRFCVS